MSEELKPCPIGHTEVERCLPRDGSMTQYDFCRCRVCEFIAETHVWQQQRLAQPYFEKVVSEWREQWHSAREMPDATITDLLAHLKSADPAEPVNVGLVHELEVRVSNYENILAFLGAPEDIIMGRVHITKPDEADMEWARKYLAKANPAKEHPHA